MTNRTPEEMWEYTQKKYQLSKKELQRLRLWLARNPDAFHEWEKMVGLTPSQIAHLIAEEFCTQFTEPVRISFGGHLSFDHAFTLESFMAFLGPHKSWRELEDGLRRIARVLPLGKEYEFCERKTFTVYETLRRKDMYGLRGESKTPEVLAKKRETEKRFFTVEVNGKKIKKEMPPFDIEQCRHCWRYVFIDTKKITKKPPLCPQHDHISSNAAYRARQRLLPKYWRIRGELQKYISPEYRKHQQPNENVVFLRRLATAEDSPFHALSSYMRSLNLPLNSDEDILRAFNFIGGIKLPKEYDNQLNDMINFLLGLNSESPVPLTILDCINAEAWLRAGKNCLYP